MIGWSAAAVQTTLPGVAPAMSLANDGTTGNDHVDGEGGFDRARTDSGDIRKSIEGPATC